MNPDIITRRNFLRSQSKRLTFGFTGILDARNAVGQEFIAGIQKAAADYDCNTIIMAETVHDSLADGMTIAPHYLKKWRFMRAPLLDGLIVHASSLERYLSKHEIAERFSALQPLPMVSLGHLAIPGIPALCTDTDFSLRLLVDHLVRVHGYQHIAFLGVRAVQPHQDRLSSCKREMAAAGVPLREDCIFLARSSDPPDIVAQTDALCKAHIHRPATTLGVTPNVQAIVTSSDTIAALVINELEKQGIHVPDDVAVTGFGNHPDGILAPLPITTVDLSPFQYGYEAVAFLIDRIMNSTATQNRLMPARLLVRETCGCFEHDIVQAGQYRHKTVSPELASETQARTFLFSQINRIFPQEPLESKNALVAAVFSDIYASAQSGQAQPKKTAALMRWARAVLSKQKNRICEMDFQHKITELRQAVLPIVAENDSPYRHIEAVFHQMRVLFSVATNYANALPREDAHFFNNMPHIALAFASATTGQQIQHILRYQLSQLQIPGIVLALSDNMTKDLEECTIQLVVPEPPEDIAKHLPYKVLREANFPKIFFPAGKRQSFVLEVLHTADRYMGYAFFQLGTHQLAVYDTISRLLTQALYGVYQREGRTKDYAVMLNTEHLSSILQAQGDPNRAEIQSRSKITVARVLAYLTEHLSEMTDLNAMAAEFNVTKTHLVRQTKKLTGYTVQTLHEKLKIEQAKDLLLLQGIRLADISARLGFMNQNYFSNVFKKNTGLSPRAWIKRNKK